MASVSVIVTFDIFSRDYILDDIRSVIAKFYESPTPLLLGKHND